ncbi:hypothetical protein AAS21_gp078 [Pantoea phage vB_PagS_AAS21]|uniref:Uncharacterized protein n=1 Tax=Pantoea phage vB_PagS_AAS21 TaxID=2575261 RepID=A0A4Y5P1J0_9CAUD|nr:hypothetical protein AAS21_gp078 [Pantoea phage vB_PagS_AAS21]
MLGRKSFKILNRGFIMYNFDKFKDDEAKELAWLVTEKLARMHGESKEDIKELAYHVGLFILLAAQGSERVMIIADTGAHETIVNPLIKSED